MRIGILTGGGDVPGLNSCIKAVVNRVEAEGRQVLGIRRGWRGLLFLDPENPSSPTACTVTLDNYYDRDHYRPRVRHVDGKPMFLY